MIVGICKEWTADELRVNRQLSTPLKLDVQVSYNEISMPWSIILLKNLTMYVGESRERNSLNCCWEWGEMPPLWRTDEGGS